MNAREDAVLLAMFDAEVETHMAVLNEGLIALEQDPNQSQWYEPLMRAAHCIKGASDLFDLKNAVKISHVIEDTFTSAREGRLAITSVVVDALLSGVDLLGRATRIEDDPNDQTEDIHLLLKDIEQASLGLSCIPPAPRHGLTLPHSGASLLTRPIALDSTWVNSVHQSVGEWAEARDHDLAVDLADISVVDPSGLALLSIISAAPSGEPRLLLQNASPELASLLTAFGLNADSAGGQR